MIANRMRWWRAWLVFLVSTTGLSAPAAATAPPSTALETVKPNDNLQSAGTLDRGTLMLALRAGVGGWQPEGEAGPTLQIEAFGEVSAALTVPAPLIRVARAP